jgi:cation diffusion facilitator family transporter
MFEPRLDAHEQALAVRRVLTTLLIVNVALVATKFGIGVVTGSLAVLGGALDSGIDVLNNGLGLVVVRVAAKGPDEDHPYGHRKFETLGTLAIVGFLSISSFELGRTAVSALLRGGHGVMLSNLQAALLALSLGVNVVAARYERASGRRLDSELLVADASHTQGDAFVTAGILVSVWAARHRLWWADPAVALAVAVVIICVAYGILARAVPVLVDERALPRDTIQRSVEAVSGVRHAYGIRSRGAPPVRYAEVTIAVDRSASVADAHAIADEVEGRLRHDLHLHEVLVHVEPC